MGGCCSPSFASAQKNGGGYRGSDPVRQLRAHHVLPVKAVAIDDEGSVTHRVKAASVRVLRVDLGCQSLQHDDAVGLKDVDHPAFDIRKTFLDQWCADLTGADAGQAKSLEFICICARTGSDTNDGVDHFDRWNGDHAIPPVVQGGP